jgi:hypothetical protein
MDHERLLADGCHQVRHRQAPASSGFLRDIAETIARGLHVPTIAIPAEAAGEHFGPFFGHAATMDMPASSEWTRKTLGWEPTGPGMIEDLANVKY